MARLTVTLEEDVAAWVKREAQRRGVSKSKVLRDCVAIAREAGTSELHSGEHATQLEELEARVAALEAAVDGVPAHIAESESSATASEEASEQNVRKQLESVLADRPPQTEHGQAAVITTVLLLREQGPMQTQELRDAVYERHGDAYASAPSLWQSIQRYLPDVPGIKKQGRGKWDYAGDEAVFNDLS